MGRELILLFFLHSVVISIQLGVSADDYKTYVENTTEMCVFCTKTTNISDYFEQNGPRDYVNSQNIQESCRRYGWYHNFYEEGGYRLSILPPSTQSDWCYFDIFYQNESYTHNGGERIYLSANDTWSSSNKWELEKESKSGLAKYLFRYTLKGNESGKQHNLKC